MISTLTRLLQRSPRRHFSTSLQLSPKHSIYISQSSDPYFNLTFEDWLFKEKPTHEPLLLIYRDRPCVVIGRNQNPWKEVNFPELHRANIPFIRRRSGGGTVYHDMGNTNFSIHLPRSSFDRNVTAELVLRAVRSLNIDARVNERNDVCVGPYKMSFSWAIVKDRAYHHGTMLISSQLGTLGDALHVSKDSMVTRGVASVRSPVKNLREFSPTVTHDTFVKAMVQTFREEYHVKEPVQYVQASDTTDSPYIQNGIAELHDWSWAFGQTPEFTYSISRAFGWGSTARIHSKYGVILSCSLTAEDTSDAMKLGELGRELEGQKYGFLDKKTTNNRGRIEEVRQWLIEEMSS
ncbi:Lipoyltransferase and lipoate-protein ligase [Lactarius akahatsu]|uniref:Putative lipoate-protein ligase A n=1 Tax=Lactarius akahatsu TaxID=416441 RepID=A0AAD4LHC5_9AGAM|nr:Lipoyltransferase and lipoate-protein ligase [Lactarius akahatsu]